jgi:cholesterol transport system auxiliary component
MKSIKQVLKAAALALSLSFVLAGCGVGKVPPAPTLLDLGALPAKADRSPATLPALAVPFFTAMGGLKSEGVVWRLGAQGTPNYYTTYQWVSSPATLVRERMINRLSEQGPVLAESINASMPQLRVTLLQFDQIYAPNGQSNAATVALQAVLVVDGQVRDQHRVIKTVQAQANTAPAGALALRQATDEAIEDVAQWLTGVFKR